MSPVAGFSSVVCADPAAAPGPVREPDFFGDLNLGRVVDAVTSGREEYDLAPFFSSPVLDGAGVDYRHEVVRDLQRPAVREPVDEFAATMRRVRGYLSQANKLRVRLQKQRWFLDAADLYCDAVATLDDRLRHVELTSQGLLGLRDYVAGYVMAAPFQTLKAEARAIREKLAVVKYCVHIRGSRVGVRRFDGEADYGAAVEKTFARFKQGVVDDYCVTFPELAEMDHVQAQILDRVALLFPEAFAALAAFCTRRVEFADSLITRFDREVQFYLGYLDFIGRISRGGLAFCLPDVTSATDEILIDDGFDLALATRLVPDGKPVVCNSVHLRGVERIVVVTGPNQGGKTTFARMFGQVPYLASLGLPVPARRAVLALPDRVFSVFEREESMATLHGRLDDELFAIRDTLQRATPRSVIVMNESFASTTLHDATVIVTEVLRRIVELGALAVYVTFVDELAALDDAVVSMVGGVVAEDPRQRTFRIVRRSADGIAYASAVAAKYGLSYPALRRRISRWRCFC